MPDMKYTKTIALITTLLCFLQGQGLALAQDNPNQYNYLYLTIRNGLCDNSIPVSYTHLTLPTKLEV